MRSQSKTQGKIYKILALILSFLLIFEQSGFAQILPLPNPFVPDAFRPLHLRYLSYDSINNNFQLLLDKGDNSKTLPYKELEEKTGDLLNYFFIGVALPNSAFWVNLRPDAEDNIIDNELARTDVGKILLEADLQLKKDTAKYTSPETPEGKEYWDKLYQKAGEVFGDDNITIPTLIRPWIVPDEIIIRETANNAYIYKATLKVMLEQDYLQGSAVYSFEDSRLKALNEYSSQLIRELIIPKLTKEINASKRYASLRQVYYSLILAQWFKAKFKGLSPTRVGTDSEGALSPPLAPKGTVPDLIDSKNLTGLTSKTPWSKTTYFKAYQKSVKNGEYNIQQSAYSPYGQTIRSYFSGGLVFKTLGMTNIQGNPGRTPFGPGIGVSFTGNPGNENIEITRGASSPQTGASQNETSASKITKQPAPTQASGKPVILTEGMPGVNFTKGNKQVSFPAEAMKRLREMAQLSRELEVELEASCYVKDGRVLKVEFPDDKNKIAVISIEPGNPKNVDIKNDQIYYSDTKDHLGRVINWAFKMANEQNYSDPRLQKGFREDLEILNETLSRFASQIDYYSIESGKRVVLNTTTIKALLDQNFTDPKKLEKFIKDIANIDYYANKWIGSSFRKIDLSPMTKDERVKIELNKELVDAIFNESVRAKESGEELRKFLRLKGLTEPQIKERLSFLAAVERGEWGRIYIHTHPVVSPPSTDDLGMPSFFNGIIHGNILPTPQGEELVLFYEPDNRNSGKYYKMFGKYWGLSRILSQFGLPWRWYPSILNDLRKVAMEGTPKAPEAPAEQPAPAPGADSESQIVTRSGDEEGGLGSMFFRGNMDSKVKKTLNRLIDNKDYAKLERTLLDEGINVYNRIQAICDLINSEDRDWLNWLKTHPDIIKHIIEAGNTESDRIISKLAKKGLLYILKNQEIGSLIEKKDYGRLRGILQDKTVSLYDKIQAICDLIDLKRDDGLKIVEDIIKDIIAIDGSYKITKKLIAKGPFDILVNIFRTADINIKKEILERILDNIAEPASLQAMRAFEPDFKDIYEGKVSVLEGWKDGARESLIRIGAYNVLRPMRPEDNLWEVNSLFEEARRFYAYDFLRKMFEDEEIDLGHRTMALEYLLNHSYFPKNDQRRIQALNLINPDIIRRILEDAKTSLSFRENALKALIEIEARQVLTALKPMLKDIVENKASSYPLSFREEAFEALVRIRARDTLKELNDDNFEKDKLSSSFLKILIKAKGIVGDYDDLIGIVKDLVGSKEYEYAREAAISTLIEEKAYGALEQLKDVLSLIIMKGKKDGVSKQVEERGLKYIEGLNAAKEILDSDIGELSGAVKTQILNIERKYPYTAELLAEKRLEAAKRKEIAKDMLIAVLFMLQDRYNLFNMAQDKAKLQGLLAKIIAETEFKKEIKGEVNSDFKIQEDYLNDMTLTKTLLGIFAHELGHNILEIRYGLDYFGRENGALHELLCDIAEFAFLENISWQEGIMESQEILRYEEYAQRHTNEAGITWEEHESARRLLASAIQVCKERGIPVVWPMFLKLGIDILDKISKEKGVDGINEIRLEKFFRELLSRYVEENRREKKLAEAGVVKEGDVPGSASFISGDEKKGRGVSTLTFEAIKEILDRPEPKDKVFDANLSEGPGTPTADQSRGRKAEVEAYLIGLLKKDTSAEELKRVTGILLDIYEKRVDELVSELNKIKEDPQKIKDLIKAVEERYPAVNEARAVEIIEEVIAEISASKAGLEETESSPSISNAVKSKLLEEGLVVMSGPEEPGFVRALTDEEIKQVLLLLEGKGIGFILKDGIKVLRVKLVQHEIQDLVRSILEVKREGGRKILSPTIIVIDTPENAYSEIVNTGLMVFYPWLINKETTDNLLNRLGPVDRRYVKDAVKEIQNAKLPKRSEATYIGLLKVALLHEVFEAAYTVIEAAALTGDNQAKRLINSWKETQRDYNRGVIFCKNMFKFAFGAGKTNYYAENFADKFAMYVDPNSLYYEFKEELTKTEKDFFRDAIKYLQAKHQSGENVFSIKDETASPSIPSTGTGNNYKGDASKISKGGPGHADLTLDATLTVLGLQASDEVRALLQKKIDSGEITLAELVGALQSIRNRQGNKRITDITEILAILGKEETEPRPMSNTQKPAIETADTKASEQSDSPSRFSKTGGIDFRQLPIVRKAIGNLKANLGSSAMEKLNSMNLDTEWQEIENLVNQGAIPQAERLKSYIQASCLKGNADKDIDKVISCIADILRIEEDFYIPTEPMLLDILVAVESVNSVQQLKAAFIGNY